MTTKKNVFGILVDSVNYRLAVENTINAAKEGLPYSVTALAVHGLITGVRDDSIRCVLNDLDLVCPDGQPVRWALNRLHQTKLTDRVYGPQLTLDLCEHAASEKIPVYFYGSRPQVLTALVENLSKRFPSLIIAGTQPSSFRSISAAERQTIASDIIKSGAKLVFCGLGCPRQEIWVHTFKSLLPMPLVAVGAAFDFHAGLLPQAPRCLQNAGLEWLFRLLCEPRRLWKRYLFLNPLYMWNLLLQFSGMRHYPIETDHQTAVTEMNCPG